MSPRLNCKRSSAGCRPRRTRRKESAVSSRSGRPNSRVADVRRVFGNAAQGLKGRAIAGGLACWPFWVVRGAARSCLGLRGGFNRSAQHLLILRGEEVCHGDVADLVHGSAEGRAVGAMEERAKCCGHLAGAGKEEQDRR